MSSGLNPAMSVPGHRVVKPWLDCDYADWAEPAFAFFGVSAVGLLHRELHTALYHGVWQGHFEHREIKFAILGFFGSSASSSTHV